MSASFLTARRILFFVPHFIYRIKHGLKDKPGITLIVNALFLAAVLSLISFASASAAATQGIVVNLCGHNKGYESGIVGARGCYNLTDSNAGCAVAANNDGGSGLGRCKLCSGCYLKTFACGADNLPSSDDNYYKCEGGESWDSRYDSRLAKIKGGQGWYNTNYASSMGTTWGYGWTLRTSGELQNDWICKVQLDVFNSSGGLIDWIVWRDTGASGRCIGCVHSAPAAPYNLYPNGQIFSSTAVASSWSTNTRNCSNCASCKDDFHAESWKNGGGVFQTLGWTQTNSWAISANQGDGLYYWHVQQGNGYDGSGWSQGYYYVDTTGPSVSLSNNTGGVWVNWNPTWSWSASDAVSGLRSPNRYYIQTRYNWGGWYGDWYNDVTSWSGSAGSNGEYEVYVYGIDNVGNWGGSGWSYGYVDKAAPTTTLSVSPTSWTNGNPTWSWSATDSGGSGLRSPNRYYYYLDGVAQGYTDSTSWAPSLANGSHYVQVYSIDNAGNWGLSSSVYGYVDKTAPSVSLSNNTGGSWVNVNPTWSWSASDADSGLRSPNRYYIYRRYNWGTWSGCSDSVYTDSTSSSCATVGDGEYEVYAYAYDNAGNQGGAPAWSYAYVDKTAPTTSLSVSPTSWTNTNPTWSWSASDTGGSGLRSPNRYYYYLDGVAQGYTDSTSWAPSLANGSHYVQVYSIDNAGNWGLSSSVYAYVDKTAPTTSLSVSPISWTNGNPTWSWSATDSGGSGLKSSSRYYYYLDGAGQGYTDSTSFQPSLSNGSHYVNVCAYDVAGNSGCSGNVYGYVDKAAPTISLSVSPTGWTNTNPTWSWSAADTGGSGLKNPTTLRYYYYLDGVGQGYTGATSWAPSLANGSHYVSVCTYDNAGNSGCSGNVYAYVDKTAPTTSLSVSPTSWTNTNPTWSWSAADTGGSGLRSPNRYYYYLDGVGQGYTDLTSYQPSLANGSHYVSVYAYDIAGNSGWSGNIYGYVDKTAPTVPLTVNYVFLSNSPRWDWSGTTDTGGSLLRSINTYYVQPSWTTAYWTTTTNYSPTLADGTYSLQVNAYDNAGNIGYSSLVPVTVDTCPYPTAPAVTESHGGACTNQDPSWSWPASTGGTIDTYEVSRSWNLTPIMQTGLSYTEALSSGTYAIQVRAHNTCGKWGNNSAAVSATVDKAAPPTPANLAPDNVCHAANNFSVTWTQPVDPAPTCGTVIQNYLVQVSEAAATNPDGSFVTVLDGAHNTWVNLPAVGGVVSYTTDLTAYMTVTPKRFYFHVKARDDAGNQSGWSVTIMQELKTGPVITSLGLTSINPSPLTPQTQQFNITSDIRASPVGSVCGTTLDTCQAWKLNRGGSDVVTYAGTECCRTLTGTPPFTDSCAVVVTDKLPGGFQENDNLTVRSRVTDHDTGLTDLRENSTIVIHYAAWFQVVNGDVYGQRISEVVAQTYAFPNNYEPWMITNDTAGALPGGLAAAANDIPVSDTAGNDYHAAERSESGSNHWQLPLYPGGMSWPDVLSNVGPSAGDFIHENNVTISLANVGSYNNKVVYADGDITLGADLRGGPAHGSPYALTAVLIANGHIIVQDTLTHPNDGSDMLKIRGGLYGKEGIDFQRDLGNNKFPAISVTYDPSVFFKNVSSLSAPKYTWREVNL